MYCTVCAVVTKGLQSRVHSWHCCAVHHYQITVFLISLVYVLFYILRLNSTDHRLSFFATTTSIENLKTLNRDNRECVDSHKRPKRINLCPTSTAVKTDSANADKCLSCRGVRVYFCDRGSVTHRHWETSYTFSQTPIYLTCSAGFSFDNRKSGLSKQWHICAVICRWIRNYCTCAAESTTSGLVTALAGIGCSDWFLLWFSLLL